MKPLLAIALIVSVPLSAQEKRYTEKQIDLFKTDTLPQRKMSPLVTDRWRERLGSYRIRGKKVGTTAYGSLYRLQQDGMPCVVPDMSQHQAMPNAFSRGIIHTDPGIYREGKRSDTTTLTIPLTK